MLRAVTLSCLLWCSVSGYIYCDVDLAKVFKVGSDIDPKDFECNIFYQQTVYLSNQGPYRGALPKLSKVENITGLVIFRLINRLPDDAFENFRVLNNVQLFQNSIKEVPAGIFANLNRLEILRLVNSEVESFAASAQLPPNLIELYIHDNKLRRLTGLAGHPRLQNLDLTNNLLTSFVMEPPNVLPSLQKLKLEGNRIKDYWTPTLSNLRNLSLKGNALTQIPADMFNGLERLSDLDLSSNSIEAIDPGAFTHTPALTYLNLDSNSLKVLDADIFLASGSTVGSFRLKNNRLQFLSLGLLVRMRNLKDISLYNNPWNCGCLDDLLSWIQEFHIRIWCREHSFNGTVPVCVVHSGEKNLCPYRYFEDDARYFIENRSEVTSDCPNIL